MNKHLLCVLSACVLACGTISACGDDQPALPAPYGEVAIGASFIPSVHTDTYTINFEGNTATGHIDLNYKTGFTGTAELGYAGIFSPDLRLGVAYDIVDAVFSNGLITGTVNGVPASLSFTKADANAVGINLSNTVNMFSGQAYYSLPLVWQFRPYIGVGAGAAIIEHASTEPAFTATAGFRSGIAGSAYWGIRYRFYWINGPKDDLGIRYQAITNHSVMVVFGTYFD